MQQSSVPLNCDLAAMRQRKRGFRTYDGLSTAIGRLESALNLSYHAFPKAIFDIHAIDTIVLTSIDPVHIFINPTIPIALNTTRRPNRLLLFTDKLMLWIAKRDRGSLGCGLWATYLALAPAGGGAHARTCTSGSLDRWRRRS